MESTKKRNYLLATILIAISLGIWAYRNYEEKKEIESLVNIMMETDKSTRSLKYIESGFSKDSLGDFKGAIEDFTKSIRIDPNNFLAYYGRGKAKFDLNIFTGALADFNKAIEIDSSSSNSYFFRGCCKFLSNDKNGACLDWNKAGDLGDTISYDFIKKNCN